MVSSLSSRLLAGRGDCASLHSNRSNGSPQHKRSVTGLLKTRRSGINEKNESCVSGYSADREGPSAYPPVVSINLHSKSKSSTGVGSLNCPKRRKKNEIQFAATSVKTDLARAGKDFKPLSKDLERSTILGNANIKFKDHVKLVHSNNVSGSLVPPSNIAKRTTITDYAALISAVRAFYPCKPTQMSDMKPFEQGQNTWSEPSASSSVSDTLSDSGSDNTNNLASTLSPLLEDSLDTSDNNVNRRQQKAKTTAKATFNPSYDISSTSNAITMTKILQISKTARYDQ